MTCAARHGSNHTCPLCRGPGRPPLSNLSPTVRFSISVPAAVRDKIARVAKHQGCTMSAATRAILERWAKRR